ncbi:hypothetical protein XENOCAPTIV_003930, partial [Xenoophorus captivus]
LWLQITTLYGSTAAFLIAFRIMSDHYGKVKVQLGQMKSLGEDAEKEEVDPEGEMPVSAPSASPDQSSCITTTGTVALGSSNVCKQTGKISSKNSFSKPVQGSAVPAHAVKNLNSPICEHTLHIKGTGKILQGKSESNGNYVAVQASRNTQESFCDDGFKLPRKRRPVMVDTSKAKTSLEALKLSIKELKWKEVWFLKLFYYFSVVSMCCAGLISTETCE